MKIKFLVTGVLGLISIAAYAQKGELNNAKDKFASYIVERQSTFTKTQADKDIAEAKASIDKASVNDKTAALPLTLALKGAIYASLTARDSVPATALPNFKIADDALGKAKVLDSAKHENKTMIDNGYSDLANYKFNEGRAEFQNKKYDLAYASFDYYRQIVPEDTTALYVTGLSATNAGATDPKYYAPAIANYSKLLTKNYAGNVGVAMDLSTIYLMKKDTAGAYKALTEAVAKFPANNDLRKREIEIGLQTGKQDEMVSKIDAAIASDPQNKVLYYYLSLTYMEITDAYAAKVKATKNPADKAGFQKKKDENNQKAIAAGKKAVEIDPEYFDGNETLGYALLSPAIEEYNAANQLPTNKQKEYDAAVAKAKSDFAAAKPYLQKAVDLKPKSVNALTNLKTYYLGMQDVPSANKIQKQIEAVPAGN